MKKKHAQVAQLLAVYHDLNQAEQCEVDRHVQECTTCAARLAAYRSMDWDLARLADPRPDERLREEFYAAIEGRDRRGRWVHRMGQRLVRLPALAGQAAELVVLALLIAALGFTLRGWLQSSPAPTPGASPTHSPVTAAPPMDISPAEMPGGQYTTEAEMADSGRTTDLVHFENSAVDSQQAAPAEPASPISSQGASVPLPTTLTQEGGEKGQVYVVMADDTLWKLAEKYLGDGHRFGEIVEATRAKRAEDPGFASIDDPNLILPGSKLWIPGPGIPPSTAAVDRKPSPATAGPNNGHIAFSFWNNSPERCTYEIDIIDVPACLTSSEACQATRRIFPLNNVSEPALSPSGDRLAFRGWGEPPSEESPYLHCAPAVKAHYLANTTLDGTEFRGTGGFWEDSHPNWSPDGQQILFDTGRDGDGIIRILLINADGSNERDLRIAGQQPSWGPDGQRFVYRGCDLTGNRCGLWLAYAAPVNSWETGSNMIGPVVQDAQAAHPDWSPTSDQIVYQSPKSGSWDLYVVNTDGSGLRQLTSDPGIEGLPSWSPDGRWIAYLSDAGGNWGIWIIRSDGSERHLLFPFDGGIFTPRAVEPYGQRDWIDEQISWSK
jgi:nucleoid-associated protein YgaU